MTSEVKVLAKKFLTPSSNTHLEEIKAFDAEEIIKELAKVIQFLIEHDLDKLFHALYRIDINEQLIRSALSEKNVEDMAYKLAQDVFQRQLKKIEYRMKFFSDT